MRDTQTSVRPERSRGALAPRPQPLDWDLAISALQSADDAAVAEALAMLAGVSKGDKAHEPHDPPKNPGRDDCDPDGEEEDEEEAEDLSARCWAQDEMGEKVWMTDFPPPPGFTAYENRPYDELGEHDSYERECTPEEVALLEAPEAADRAADRAEDEELRDAWFKALKEAANKEAEAPADDAPADDDQIM